MTENNSNVKQFIIKNYLESEVNPDFAILVNGPWGCGKSFFIDNLLKEKYGEDYRKKDVIWLSLFGLSEIYQVQKNFLNYFILYLLIVLRNLFLML